VNCCKRICTVSTCSNEGHGLTLLLRWMVCRSDSFSH